MRTSTYVASFLFALCGGCASTKLPPQGPAPLSEAELTPVSQAAPVAPSVAGDIQFTMTDRKAKAAPEVDDPSAATTLQPTKASTSGVTTTGVTTQHVHASQ
jgi:hypothetical protein